MRVFLTGATGFIGSHILPELLSVGHQVLGMTRSEPGARALEKAGAATHWASLEDTESLRAGAAKADAVIHAAFDHDFGNFVANCEKDKRVIEALGGELKGTGRPLIITSGVGMGEQGHNRPAIETVFNPAHANPRVASELAAQRVSEGGVDVRVVRLPQVHNTLKQGLITPYIEACRDTGVAAYVAQGLNRWSAAHVSDVAKLYVLALDRGRAGERYHAVAEEGISARQIAETVGWGLGLPSKSITSADAARHFGWLTIFVGLDMAASSTLTRERLDWTPIGPSLIDDLERIDYSGCKSHK
jgi:nucleoside-diphosphate-sugar epimerase